MFIRTGGYKRGPRLGFEKSDRKQLNAMLITLGIIDFFVIAPVIEFFALTHGLSSLSTDPIFILYLILVFRLYALTRTISIAVAAVNVLAMLWYILKYRPERVTTLWLLAGCFAFMAYMAVMIAVVV